MRKYSNPIYQHYKVELSKNSIRIPLQINVHQFNNTTVSERNRPINTNQIEHEKHYINLQYAVTVFEETVFVHGARVFELAGVLGIGNVREFIFRFEIEDFEAFTVTLHITYIRYDQENGDQ